MKKLVTVTEEAGEGLVKLMGENVILFCLNYIYTGKLIGVNTTCVLLRDAKIVYETGAFSDKKFKDAQDIASEYYVQTTAIESFGKTDKT
jgi:hypothetical protein